MLFFDIIFSQRKNVMKKDAILLSKNDVLNIKNKQIAFGSEGTIYGVGNVVFYKIYHHYSDEVLFKIEPIYDEDGVNIANYKTGKKEILKNNTLRYMNEEGMRLSREEALYKAIERQKEIYQTFLPQNIIYVDGRIKGCVLHEHKHSLNIYKLDFFPFRYRLEILKKLLIKVQELVEHNIYHIDLAQRPNKLSLNTNILLQFPNNPQIIDLDGHSAIYTEFFSKEALKKTEASFAMLLMEILTNMDLESYLNNMAVEGILNPNELENVIIETIMQASKNRIEPLMIKNFLHNELSLDRMDFYLNKLSRKINL